MLDVTASLLDVAGILEFVVCLVRSGDCRPEGQKQNAREHEQACVFNLPEI